MLPPEKLGSLIGAAFGLVFVLANTGSLPGPVAGVLRVLAVAAAVAVIVLVRRPSPALQGAGGGFGRGYWLVVGAEVVALFGGLAVLNGPLQAPQAAVAWVALVVGLHFTALAVVWREPAFFVLGAAMAACGAVGLGLAALGSGAVPIDVVAGVVPGGLLLAAALWGVTGGPARRRSPVASR